MKKTFAELKEAVQDITPPHVDVGSFLNQAQIDLAKSSKQKKRTKMSPENGKIELPGDVLILLTASYAGVPLALYPAQETPELGSGTPRFYQLDNGVLGLYPTPDSGSTEEVELVYTPRPTTLVNDEDVSILDDADNALISYAKWKIYTRKEDFYAAEFWRGEYYNEKAEWLALDDRQNRQPRRMQTRAYR